MNIKPLTGQVLVELLPVELKEGSLFIPEQTNPLNKKPVIRATVLAMGPWKKSKTGFGILPDFGVGATVYMSPHSGTTLEIDGKRNFRLVKTSDILAIDSLG